MSKLQCKKIADDKVAAAGFIGQALCCIHDSQLAAVENQQSVEDLADLEADRAALAEIYERFSGCATTVSGRYAQAIGAAPEGR